MIDIHDYFELDEDFIVRWKRRGPRGARPGEELQSDVSIGEYTLTPREIFGWLFKLPALADSEANANLEEERSAHIEVLEDTVRLQAEKLKQLEGYMKEMQRVITMGQSQLVAAPTTEGRNT